MDALKGNAILRLSRSAAAENGLIALIAPHAQILTSAAKLLNAPHQKIAAAQIKMTPYATRTANRARTRIAAVRHAILRETAQ